MSVGFNNVDASAAVWRLKQWHKAGYTLVEIAAAHSLGRAQVRNLLNGRTDFIDVEVRSHILSVPLPPLDPTREDEWRDGAACKGMDPNLFFAEHVGAQPSRQAKAACDRCPVRGECLDWALDNSEAERYAFLGGHTYTERREIARVRRAAADAFDSLREAM